MPILDLVRRKFAATALDKLWLADITYVKTHEGFLYLAFVLNAHSRRVVGWSMAGRNTPCISFGKRLKEVSVVPSMGRTGSVLDNAMAESFVSTLKAELVDRNRFPT